MQNTSGTHNVNHTYNRGDVVGGSVLAVNKALEENRTPNLTLLSFMFSQKIALN